MKNSQLVKRNTVAGGYTRIYPLAYIQGVADGLTGKALSSILQSFNHVYLDYEGSAVGTRVSLPNDYRRQGIWITYNTGNSIITEIYKGSANDLNNDALFSDDINWEIVPDIKYVQSNASKIPNGTILPDHLSPALWELLGSNNTITNLPDEEDLTQECNVLSFKDRVYDSEAGNGYKILRKNWVTGVNVLEPDELSLEHTIYEIRYNFDLQGQTITLPEGCTLLFKGGTLNNGTVVCNDTNIIGINEFEDGGTATYSGTFDKGLTMSMDDTIKWYNGTEWVEIEGTGGIVDPSTLTARVVEVTSPQEATASVQIVNKELQFKFGLPRGEKGDQGPQGEPGPQGPAGDIAVATQTFIVFKSTGESIATPDTPTGGHWNSTTNEFTPPAGWSRTDELEGIVWMSSGIFRADTGELIDEWTTPVRVTGQDGSNGTDGTSIEFIFKLTETSLEPPYLDVTDSPNTNEYVPEGWADSPAGISAEYQCEWVSIRRKEEDGAWSNWAEPAIWSKWGVNGTDGDGVEYIFFRNNGTPVSNPTPEDTSSDQYQEKGDYEGIEYVPAGWSDNPQGVNSDLKYEWVSQRKYRESVWGRFSDPAVWAKYGDDGYSGLSLRTMYAKEDIGETPVVVKDNINPGSIWGTVFPDYNSETEAVWCIQAYVTYDNKLATTEDGAAYEGWQGPWIITGTAGKDGVPPNYKTYVYKKSDSKPAKPTGTDLIPAGWVDYPDDIGQWWQCIGTVNGVTDLVIEWSEVLPVNGQDGTAQDGKFTEMRFAVNQSRVSAPSLSKTTRNPSGWTIAPPTVNEGYYLWMTTAVILPNDTLESSWSDPVCISGEKGPQGETGPAGERGPTGSQGVSGIPGVSIEVRYCLGTAISYDGTRVPTGNNPSGWSTSIPSVTSSKPYIWCIQGRRTYSSASDGTGTINWDTPFRLSGLNGLNGINGNDGEDGKRGQLVYPAGIYSNTTSYTTDEYKAPYVLDPSDNNFYVLNAIMTWRGTSQGNRTPSQDYAQNNGKYWLKFDAFEAVYAKIGIIANGLIGSAVFNGDFMFSQQGIIGEYKTATSTDFELFDPSKTDINIAQVTGVVNSTSNLPPASSSNGKKYVVREDSYIYTSNGSSWIKGTKYTFIPNIMFNFKTGAGHLAAGKIRFDKEGNVYTNGYNENLIQSPVGTNGTITIDLADGLNVYANSGANGSPTNITVTYSGDIPSDYTARGIIVVEGRGQHSLTVNNILLFPDTASIESGYELVIIEVIILPSLFDFAGRGERIMTLNITAYEGGGMVNQQEAIGATSMYVLI